MISRKFKQTIILLILCLGLISSLALAVFAIYPDLPGTNVGWNSYGAVPSLDKEFRPMVGWNAYELELPSSDAPNVGWNSYSLVLPVDKDPKFSPCVGWNT